MIVVLFLLALHGTGAYAAEFHRFPPSKNEKALILAQAYLAEPNAIKAYRIWKNIEALQPEGLVYIDKMLKLLTQDMRSWNYTRGRRLWLLAQLPNAVDENVPLINFSRSSLKNSIHKNAQKLLFRFQKTKNTRREIVVLYDRLNLWDETDLPFLIPEYFRDRSYGPLLIRYLQFGSDQSKRRFAERVRREGNFELIETSLLYQFYLLRDGELYWLFQRLLENTYFGKTFASDIFDFYGQGSATVMRLRLKVMMHLHQRLREHDPVILPVYNHFRQHLAMPGYAPPTPEQARIYKKFLRDLWAGRFNESCELRLIDPDDP
jgi:hypothetical protein